jgi:cell division protein FtsB
MPRTPARSDPVQPRRRTTPVPAPWAWNILGRRALRFLLLFAAIVLMIDALFGERGFVETMRARRQHDHLGRSIARLKTENAGLREQARRLREDREAIEEVARRDLGLIKPGELLFIITDRHRPGGHRQDDGSPRR